MQSANTSFQKNGQDDDEKMVEDILSEPLSPEVSFSSDACKMDLDNNEIPSLLPFDSKIRGEDFGGEEFNVALAMRDRVMFRDISQLESDQVSGQRLSLPPPQDKQILPFPIITSSPECVDQVQQATNFYFYPILKPHLDELSITEQVDIATSDESTEPDISQPANHRHAREKERSRKALIRKIETGQKHSADAIGTIVTLADLPMTEGGWKGLDYGYRKEEKLRKLWRDGVIGQEMAIKKFVKVPYIGRPTWLVDMQGIGWGFRTERLAFMLEPRPGKSSLQELFDWECATYMERCGDISKQAQDDNDRGDHWYHIDGADRQNKTLPNWTSWHKKHRLNTLWLLGAGRLESATRRLIDYASQILAIRIPIMAARVLACQKSLEALGVDPEIAKPLFGLWYNYCINGARPTGPVVGVSCQPHTDGQNLALMMCCLYIYGKFDWKEKAWLVLWEAKLVVELPVGVLFFYPSALFIHFNIDIADFNRHIVTTKTGERPTPENPGIPMHGVKGRGSIVLFNQASMFQLAEVGHPIKVAKKMGIDSASDNDTYIAGMPRPTVDV